MKSKQALLIGGVIASALFASSLTTEAEAATRLLKQGSSGQDVKALNEQLHKLGFQVSKTSTSYSTQTKNAVIRFQKANKLKADGIVGPLTRNALNNKIASLAKTQSQNIKVESVKKVTVSYHRTLKLNVRGTDVLQLKKDLRTVGFAVKTEKTNVFDSETKKQVIAFQKSKKLVQDGIVGPNTKTALLNALKEKQTVSTPKPVVTKPTTPVSKPAPVATAPTSATPSTPSVTPVVEQKEVKSFYMTGRGWGHSVGMTQWGAKGMAEKGFKYEDILKYYYTGVDFEVKDTSSQDIRVLLKLSTPQGEFSSSEDYKIVDKTTSETLLQSQALSGTTISFENEEFIIKNGNKEIRTKNEVIVEGASTIAFNGLRYYGVLEVSKGSASTVSIINRVNLEVYLRGVVPHEISPSWPQESIKAQILAARTYSLKRIQPSNKFDVYDNVTSQVYKGAVGEHTLVNQLIDGTKGQVITYSGKLIDALYSASAGGHTVDAADVWGNHVPYLIGKPDPYDNSKYMQNWWKYSVTVNDLSRYFPEVGTLKKIVVLEMKKERPSKIKVVGDKGEKTLTGTEFRSRVGYDKIQSSIFSIEEIY